MSLLLSLSSSLSSRMCLGRSSLCRPRTFFGFVRLFLAEFSRWLFSAVLRRMPSRTHLAEAGMPSPIRHGPEVWRLLRIFDGQDLVHLPVAVHFDDKDLVVLLMNSVTSS
jgi:hypothetical protein